MKSDMVEDASMPIEPGQMEVSANVYVEFKY